jgi:NhaP-type Na+/H+ or K+/H+ antiporter
MSIPRSTDAVLRGESLFNDASALLLFGAALAVQSAGGLDATVALHVGLAVPGGVLLGLAAAWLVSRINRFVTGTLGGNLLQFVNTILLWIVAERLGLSAVLAIVAFAMKIAADGETKASARMRVHSYAVWSAVVFVLNVMAFLLMGMQARRIVGDMAGPHLRDALAFAGLVVLIVVVARVAMAIAFNRAMHWFWRRRGEPARATIRQAVLTSWSGMRGLVTLATAFALPGDFPQRDVVVLAAFAVVIATLVVQGMTLAPLIRLLGLDRRADGEGELVAVRAELAGAALASLDGVRDEAAAPLRMAFEIEHRALRDAAGVAAHDRYRELALAAIAAQRDALETIRAEHRINADEYNRLLEDIDWRELTALPEEGRRIEES